MLPFSLQLPCELLHYTLRATWARFFLGCSVLVFGPAFLLLPPGPLDYLLSSFSKIRSFFFFFFLISFLRFVLAVSYESHSIFLGGYCCHRDI